MKPAFIRFLFLCSLIFATLAMSAQVVTGTPAFGTFKAFGPTVLDIANLNSRVTIPIMSKPGRGTPFHYAMAYDNSVWVPLGDPANRSWQPQPYFGWHGISEAVTGYLSYSMASLPCPPGPVPTPPPHGHETVFAGFVYYDTFGVPHRFLATAVTNSECDDIDHDLLNQPASDGSGYSLTFQPNSGGPTEIRAVNGVVIHPPENNPRGSGSVTDVNGNVISTNMTSGANGAGTFTDTLGTTALAVLGIAPNPVSLIYTDSNGISQSVILNYQALSVRTNFGCNQIAEYSAPNQPLLTSIVFPDQSSYTFTYESTPGDAASVTGRIASITLPTGATINYAYTGGSNGIVCDDGSAAGINVTTSDGGTWQYSRSGSGTQWTTTLTDPAGNQTLYSFSGIYQKQVLAYSGAVGGSAAFSMFTCYNIDTTTGCVQGEVFPPILEKVDQVQLDNAQTGFTKTFYDSGLPTEVDQYHYGSGQAGPLARRTVINYASLGNRIFDRQSDVTVFDANGNQVAKTTFSYDDTNLTATSGLPQHVPVAGSRGNLTHRSEWLNTSNSFLTTTYNYFDTGMLQSVSDPGGHVATFSYDSSGAYVSQLALPDTSSPGLAHHIISAGYDTHTGLVTSGSDENGNLATFFYDSRLRPTQTNLPDGGQTTISYPDPRHVITRQTLMDPFATFSQVELDSYGRVSRMVVANGETAPFDFDTQDSCYDFMGRLVFQSYPLQNAGLATAKVCSGAGDIYSYDALGRILSLTHSDGSSVQYRYAGRATQITDEGNAVSRILQADALGRLTQVCEVSNNTLLGSGGIPTSCGLDIAATGFLTSYSYDTLDNLTTVTQGSLTNRSYAYDSLGRMISETEPEWGSNTSYAYDNDGLQVQRIRPAPNQTDPNVKVTTTYTYDALHRPLSISYDDGKTDGAHFNYDERSVGVAALNNSIGRMTSAANSSTGTINSFDSIGRIVTSWQRTPSTATPFQLDYRYDSAGNLISSTSGAGATFSYSYNTAGRLTSMLSSTGDANHPPQLLSNVHYGAFGMVSAALGNGVQESAGFTPRGQLNSYAAVPPPNAHNYQGFVDHAGCDTIFGWAADRNHLNTSITVTIYDNGIALPAVLANAFRSDVAALLGDNGLHGFGIPTPTSMLDGRTHQVNVKFENSGTDLGFSPVSLTCVTISVLPQSASLFGGQTQTFTANVAGTSNTAVTWSIDPSSVGSISAAGVYTAPASVTATQTVIAKATSNADPSRTATATITLNPPVSISVSPTSATLVPSETLQLVATVGNTSNTAVTWSLNPNNIGTISAVGLYTAPASVIGLQTVVVTATSQADPSKSASAPIRVGVFQVSPPSVLLQAGQTAQFSATYGGSPATVTWSINPPVGTISTGGLYTAPTPVASAQTVTVSAADGFSHTASATISLVPVVVTVLPPAVSLTNNQTQQFTANVTGSTNTGVTWFLNPNVGTISSAGLYTAPASISAQQTVNAIATSSVDPSKSNFAVITLNPPVSISVSPTSATLVPNETLQLVATVGNTSNTAVTWSLNTNIGTISAGGLYTAPASVSGLQTVVATATSVADPSKFASTPIRVGVFQVSPPSVSLQAGQTAQFSATYGGSPATVTWSIKPVVGTISSGGLYTAPTPVASAQTVKVTATDGFSHSTSATISLVPVAVTVLPPTVSLTSNQTQQFTANVTGSTNTGVTWSLNPNVGTISSAGLYTAPSSISTQQTVTVTATSLADSSKTGSAAITLNPAISITIFPLGPTLMANQTQQFTATVSGTSNTAVTWSLSPNVGTISASGLYTAPATINAQQIVNVMATSQADPTKIAMAPVTLLPTVSPTVQLNNLTHPGNMHFLVGDSFQVVVHGGANQAVTASATQDGVFLGNTSYGSTNASGNFTLTGVMSATPSTVTLSPFETWTETWYVGGVAATPNLSFTVAPPLAITGVQFTDQFNSGTTMPAPSGTTAINVVWSTNINANCTYGGSAANGNGTTGHSVTRSPLFDGFSETQIIACSDSSNSSNSTSVSVSIAVSSN